MAQGLGEAEWEERNDGGDGGIGVDAEDGIAGADDAGTQE